jgi:hypothetical protein
MSELVKMYPAQAKSTETSLSGALTAAGTTINVVDGSALPDAPNLLTIGADGSTAETVLMTAKNGNTLTVTRAQDGTTARAWSAGDVIARYFTAADQNAMQENIKKLDSEKAAKAASPVAGNLAGLDASGNPTDSGKKPADFADANHTHAGKADKVTSATAGHFAGLDANGNLTDSGKKASDFAAASHAHAGYAEVKIFSGVSVAASAWASDSTYAAYPYAASIACSGVTASHVPEVVFGATEAASGNFAPVALSGSGTVKIYAATKPTAAITVQSITCIKAVS